MWVGLQSGAWVVVDRQNGESWTSSDDPDEARRDDLLTVDQAAERIGVSPATIRNWVDSGKLPSTRIGLGEKPRIRIAPEDVDAAITHAG